MNGRIVITQFSARLGLLTTSRYVKFGSMFHLPPDMILQFALGGNFRFAEL